MDDWLEIDEELAWEWLGTYEMALKGDAAIDAYDCDETLHARSALEFVRSRLTAEQVAELDAADKLWRDNAAAFNACFAYQHARKDRDTEMKGWAWNHRSNWPQIPREHWWWWPINDTTA